MNSLRKRVKTDSTIYNKTVQGFFKNKEACPSSGDFGGIFAGYLEDIWRNFEGNVKEMWMKLRGYYKGKKRSFFF